MSQEQSQSKSQSQSKLLADGKIPKPERMALAAMYAAKLAKLASKANPKIPTLGQISDVVDNLKKFERLKPIVFGSEGPTYETMLEILWDVQEERRMAEGLSEKLKEAHPKLLKNFDLLISRLNDMLQELRHS